MLNWFKHNRAPSAAWSMLLNAPDIINDAVFLKFEMPDLHDDLNKECYQTKAPYARIGRTIDSYTHSILCSLSLHILPMEFLQE